MAKNSPSSIRVASPPFTMGQLFPAWIWYGMMECPFRLRTAFTWCTLPSSSTSYDSMHSWMAAPMSHSRTSMPASRMPQSVASFTAVTSGSYLPAGRVMCA